MIINYTVNKVIGVTNQRAPSVMGGTERAMKLCRCWRGTLSRVSKRREFPPLRKSRCVVRIESATWDFQDRENEIDS